MTIAEANELFDICEAIEMTPMELLDYQSRSPKKEVV